MKHFILAVAFYCISTTCHGAIIFVNNVDATDTRIFSGFSATDTTTAAEAAANIDRFTLTQTSDFDGDGVDDVFTFDFIRSTHANSTITGSDVTVGANNNGGNTNNLFSNFGDRDTLNLEVQNISYVSGASNAIVTASFDGFQEVSRINFTSGTGAGSASIGHLVHTGPVGSTTVTTTGGTIDLTSAGNATSVFITAPAGSGGIRLRDADLQFSVVPEPSFGVLLGLGGLALMLRRRLRSIC